MVGERRLDLLVIRLIVDRRQHASRRQDPESSGNPTRRVGRPQRDWNALRDAMTTQLMRKPERAIGKVRTVP